MLKVNTLGRFGTYVSAALVILMRWSREFVSNISNIYSTLSLCPKIIHGEAWWLSDRASDSRARGQGFDPHLGRRVVSLSKIHLPPKKY